MCGSCRVTVGKEVKFAGLVFADWQKAGATGALITQGLLAILVIAIKGSLIGWVAYAWFTRKTVRPRLSEAEPIAEVV